MQNDVQSITEKYGIQVYRTNPSIPAKEDIARKRKTKIGDDRKGIIINDGTGEIMGDGAAVVYEWEEVDQERFVKLFLAGVKQVAELKKPGLAIFELVYKALRDHPGEDTVRLAFSETQMKRSTFYNGLRELLEKGVLYRSPWDGVFFVNIRYMFNGDRLAFVKAFHLRGGNGQQRKLPAAL